MIWDVAIVGGGPAGLAAALEARRVGCTVVVLERRSAPVDKACGEGLMPPGLAALERLGVRARIPADACAPFTSIRFVQEDDRFVEGLLPAPGGLGIRRTALARALTESAREAGVEVYEDCEVRGHAIDADGVRVQANGLELRARLLVAADGLHSPLRRAAGLERPDAGPKRFGVRQHFAIAADGPRVEVHFSQGVEAYVTPAGEKRIGVAFLWEDGALAEPTGFARLLRHFPALAARLADAPPDSEIRGAGPMRHAVRTRVLDRFVLLGDAAGYVDAITGEGLSLGFASAAALADVLPKALAEGATAASLAPYARAVASAFTDYSRRASTLVWLARHPTLRRFALDRLITRPWIFERLLRSAATH